MTKRFCNGCGVEISDYEAWSVTVTPSFGNGLEHRAKQLFMTDLCWSCVEPAAQVVKGAA